MKIFFLEDHEFFAQEIIEYLTDDCGHEVFYAANWYKAEEILKDNTFDVSIIDVILKNGKTGVQIVEQYSNVLGRVLFLTGCTDEVTIETINKYSSISKLSLLWEPLDCFLNGGSPKIV